MVPLSVVYKNRAVRFKPLSERMVSRLEAIAALALAALVAWVLWCWCAPAAAAAPPPPPRGGGGGDYDCDCPGKTVPAMAAGPVGLADLGVAELAEESADAFVAGAPAGGRPRVLLVYAPWCGFCKALVPAFAEAVRLTRGSVDFGALDGDRAPRFMRARGIAGYPHVMRVSPGGGAAEVYAGERTARGLARFFAGGSTAGGG